MACRMCGAALTELAGNPPFGTCQKLALQGAKESGSSKENLTRGCFCYEKTRGVLEMLLAATDPSALQKLDAREPDGVIGVY